MAGEVEQAECFAGQPIAEFSQREMHFLQRGIFTLNDLEARLLQQRRHVGGVAGRIGETVAGIGAVTDDEGEAVRFGRLRGLKALRGREAREHRE